MEGLINIIGLCIGLIVFMIALIEAFIYIGKSE